MPGHGLVLVVEDERSIADLLKMYLTREGFGVHIAADGPEALAPQKFLRFEFHAVSKNVVRLTLRRSISQGRASAGTEASRNNTPLIQMRIDSKSVPRIPPSFWEISRASALRRVCT